MALIPLKLSYSRTNFMPPLIANACVLLMFALARGRANFDPRALRVSKGDSRIAILRRVFRLARGIDAMLAVGATAMFDFDERSDLDGSRAFTPAALAADSATAPAARAPENTTRSMFAM